MKMQRSFSECTKVVQGDVLVAFHFTLGYRKEFRAAVGISFVTVLTAEKIAVR